MPKNVFFSSKKHKNTLKINLNSHTPILFHQPLNPGSNIIIVKLSFPFAPSLTCELCVKRNKKINP